MDLRLAIQTVEMSFDITLGLWPITLLTLGTAIWGLVALAKAHKLRAWQSLAVFASVLFPAMVVPVYTVRFWADPKVHSPATQELPLNVLFVGWGVFALVLVVSTVFARGFRLPLAGVASLVVWFAAGVYLISVMAVSGTWL